MKLFKLFSVVIAATLAFSSTSSVAADNELVFVSWGGAYQSMIRKAWIIPFTRETGVYVLEETDPNTAKVKTMVDTNSVSWDIITDGETGVIRAAKVGLIEEITPSMVNQDHIYPEMRNAFGVPSEVFSTPFAFSTEEFPESGPQPKTWADFFDVKKFPGKRAIRSTPDTVLEAALMADGVLFDQVNDVLKTPEGLDRAFNKINKIKPHVALWYSAGGQPVQALGSGEVVMSMGWNGRFQKGIDRGLPLKIVWDGAIIEQGYFMMVKGAPNKGPAVKFLNHIVSPKSQSEFYKYAAYGPVTAKAWDNIPKDEWAKLPSSPDKIEKAVFLDAEWWVENNTVIRERYQATISN
jgi:putative spermidine/putrescine transport system substrate-binding protein